MGLAAGNLLALLIKAAVKGHVINGFNPVMANDTRTDKSGCGLADLKTSDAKFLPYLRQQPLKA